MLDSITCDVTVLYMLYVFFVKLFVKCGYICMNSFVFSTCKLIFGTVIVHYRLCLHIYIYIYISYANTPYIMLYTRLMLVNMYIWGYSYCKV